MEPKFSIPEMSSLLNITRQAVHKKLKEKSIQTKKKGNLSYLTFEEARNFFEFNFEQVIATMHIVKGGVGKTTLTQSIGVRSSLYGARTLIIDVDPQANLTDSFNVDPYERPVLIDIIKDNLPVSESIVNVLPGVDILPSRIENIGLDPTIIIARIPLEIAFAQLIEQIKDNYDLILFDCPPAIGASVTAAILSSNIIIAPIIPAKYAEKALEIILNELKTIKRNYKRNIPLKILLNNFDNRKSRSHQTLSTVMSNPVYRDQMLQSFVRTSQTFENVLEEQETIFDNTRWTVEKEDIDLITREILNIEV